MTITHSALRLDDSAPLHMLPFLCYIVLEIKDVSALSKLMSSWLYIIPIYIIVFILHHTIFLFLLWRCSTFLIDLVQERKFEISEMYKEMLLQGHKLRRERKTYTALNEKLFKLWEDQEKRNFFWISFTVLCKIVLWF